MRQGKESQQIKRRIEPERRRPKATTNGIDMPHTGVPSGGSEDDEGDALSILGAGTTGTNGMCCLLCFGKVAHEDVCTSYMYVPIDLKTTDI